MSTWQEKDDLELTEDDFDTMFAAATPVELAEHGRLPGGAVLVMASPSANPGPALQLRPQAAMGLAHQLLV